MPELEIVPLVLFGARGYTAAELLRLLAMHPRIKPAVAVSRSRSGASLDTLQPHVAGRFPGVVSGTPQQAFTYLAQHPEAVIALCTGSGESAPIVAALGAAGLLEKRVLVDLSGDFRLASAVEYERWYGKPHAALEWLGHFDYCLPELHRGQCQARLISNPGCMATAVQLALAPAWRAGLIEPRLHVFGITGSSGSGATPKPTTHHPERAHNFFAYKPLTHQHTPEIRRGLALPESTELSFVAHSAPLVRGISVTALLELKSGIRGEDFVRAYARFAEAEAMLEFVSEPPDLNGLVGTNLARLGAVVQGKQAVAFCAIDNLTRGASGQALQNLNRVLGLPETTGLNHPGLSPA